MGRKSLKQVYGESWQRGITETRISVRIPKILLENKPKNKTMSEFIRDKLLVSDKKILVSDKKDELIEFLQEHFEKAKSKKWNYNPRAKFWKKLEDFF